MKPVDAIFVVAAASVAAQSTDGLPVCAQDCLNAFISGSQIADCSRFNVGCICANNDFIDGIGCCLLDSCPEADQTVAIEYAATICGAQGVTVPTEITCSTSQSEPSTTVIPETAGAISITGMGCLAAGFLAAGVALL